MEKKTGENSESSEHLQYTEIYLMHLEGESYRHIKDLSAYDTTMPRMISMKVQDTFVRCDIILTPDNLKYLLKIFEGVDTTEMRVMRKRSIQKALLFLYDVQQKMK